MKCLVFCLLQLSVFLSFSSEAETNEQGKILSQYSMDGAIKYYQGHFFLSDSGFAVFSYAGIHETAIIVDIYTGKKINTVHFDKGALFQGYDDSLKQIYTVKESLLTAYNLQGERLWSYNSPDQMRDSSIQYQKDKNLLGLFHEDRLVYLNPQTGQVTKKLRLPQNPANFTWYGTFLNGNLEQSLFFYDIQEPETFYSVSEQDQITYLTLPFSAEEKYPNRSWINFSGFSPDGQSIIWSFYYRLEKRLKPVTLIYSWPDKNLISTLEGVQLFATEPGRQFNPIGNDHTLFETLYNGKESVRLHAIDFNGTSLWKSPSIKTGNLYPYAMEMSPNKKFAMIVSSHYSAVGYVAHFLELP